MTRSERREIVRQSIAARRVARRKWHRSRFMRMARRSRIVSITIGGREISGVTNARVVMRLPGAVRIAPVTCTFTLTDERPIDGQGHPVQAAPEAGRE